MGAAISLFEGASVIKIPPSRFLPVKKCNDLLLIRSNRFIFSKESHLTLNPDIGSKTIQINLDPKYYGKIDGLDKRFNNGVPSLTDCESLTIKGDVRFEDNVTIKGRVVITNKGKTQAVIKEGTVVDKDLIFK
jgi:UTP--glucose-1-phosphate uridylyltransferase